MRRRVAMVTGGLAFLTATLSLPVHAQDNYEIQVYAYDQVEPHHTMVELHSNFTFQGSKTSQDGLLPTNHQLHETIEITHGFTEWFETGFYIFTSAQNGQGWDWVGDHIRPRVHIPKEWKWPVGLSLSNEIGYQRRQYSTDTWTWEIRPIIDKQAGPWYFSFNPAFDRSFHGESVHQGLTFSPDFKLSYDFTKKITDRIDGTAGQFPGPARMLQEQGNFALEFLRPGRIKICAMCMLLKKALHLFQFSVKTRSSKRGR